MIMKKFRNRKISLNIEMDENKFCLYNWKGMKDSFEKINEKLKKIKKFQMDILKSLIKFKICQSNIP